MGIGNETLVEGPYGEKYTFRKIRPADIEKVVQHIKDYFLRDEPTCALLGYSDEYGEEFGAITRKLILDGLSFWAEDNETGNVAAVRITFRHRKDTNFDGLPMNTRAIKEICRLVDMCHQGCNLFKYYNLEEYADFFTASCAPAHRRQGLTTELYRRSLKFLAAEGFKMAKSVFTNPHTRSAARKLGFEQVFRLDYKDFMAEDGTPCFDSSILNEEHYAALMCKEL